ncbi:lactose regulatory protein LAC9 [Dactylonectria estremocensis]|uniref:Lactose regulatory protein LAC9 n=1 Tax=Dactylonectria estremocensis TaxID=1079267 RepID=A0A9P9IH35_9HYPO|nr:lactose regulatory protein LAC9 [Dactylonectria estremocensis]
MSGVARELDFACDTCRVKKFKCSKQRPSCSACLHHGRTCHYSRKVLRSPLTRAYLTSVERRMQQLEDLLSQLHPDLNIEEAIAANNKERRVSTASSSAQPFVAEGPSVSTSAPKKPTEESISEAVPEEADGFDWQEDVNELADGMAALSVAPSGTGYLGSTAGVFFLRRHVPPSLLNQAETSSRVSQSVASRQVMEQLIDSYFAVYHRTYPFVHEATFRAQFHEVLPQPQQRSWQMLLHTILALGAWCLNDSQSELDDGLYHRALSFGEDESLFASANLTFVQALVLLSNLSQKRNKPNTGSNLLGLATRMALSLGLHRELPNWDISLLQREMRRRVWWGLYIFDSGASTTFGRPILLPGKESMDVRAVMNIPDEYLTATTAALPVESAEPTLYSGMKWQSELHVQSNYISNSLLSSTGVSSEDAWAMNRALDAWTETLPPYFQLNQESSSGDTSFLFAKCRLWWRFWNLKIILFRQLMVKRAVERSRKGGGSITWTEADDRSRTIAVSAASSTIASIQSFSQTEFVTRLVTWYSVFFLFHASLVISLAILGDAESPKRTEWQNDLDVARDVFRNVYANNPLAQRCADILDLLVPGPTVETNDWENIQLDPSLMELSMWDTGSGDFFSFFGWQDPSMS